MVADGPWALAVRISTAMKAAPTPGFRSVFGRSSEATLPSVS